MRKITLLLVALFAMVGSALAQLPANGDVGYLYNVNAKKFISGDVVGTDGRNHATTSVTGIKYTIIIDSGKWRFDTGVAPAVDNEGNIRLSRCQDNSQDRVTTQECWGWSKWDLKVVEGNEFRIYNQYAGTSANFAKNNCLTVQDDGTLTIVPEADASSWKFVSEADLATYQAEALVANKDALIASAPTDDMDATIKANMDAAIAALNAEATVDNYVAAENAIRLAKESAELYKEIKATKDALAAMNDGAGLKSGDEITILLKNPNFTDGGTGWDVNNGKIEKKGSSDNPVVTAFNYTFDVSQTIKGLPAGNYKVKAQAFSRPTTNQGSLDLLAEGAELENNCVLYANGVEKYVMQLTDEHLTEAGSGTWSSHEVGGATIYLPNNGGAFSDAFSRGMYENELDFTVGTDGILTLGIKNTKSPSGQGETYCGYDNFRLFYIGEDPATGISSVEKKAPVKAIFNIAGQQMNGLQKGLNIVDGKKVLVK